MTEQLRVVIKQFSAPRCNRGGQELFLPGDRLLVTQREGACVIFVRESDRTRANPYMALLGSFDTKAALDNSASPPKKPASPIERRVHSRRDRKSTRLNSSHVSES